MQHSWIEIDIGFVNNTLDKPYSMYERSRVLERFILSVRHSIDGDEGGEKEMKENADIDNDESKQ